MIETAKAVGLNYIVVTDHVSLKGRDAGFEGFSDDLFVCVGYEHNDAANINHYLALGSNSVVTYTNDAQGYINKIKETGGIGFIAHPIEKRHYFKKYPPYPWIEWNATGFDGIELWNQMSDWLENLRSWLHFFRLFYPRRFLLEAPRELLGRWDALNRNRFVSGIGGVDAHSMKVRLGIFLFTIFPIKVELKGIRTHLYFSRPLPKGDAAAAKAMLLDALKNGRGFISNYRRGDARGAEIYLVDKNGHAVMPGSPTADICLPAMLKVNLPEPALVKLVANGEYIDKRKGWQVEFPISSRRVFRIEVYKGKHAWIYSNPFPVGPYPL
ncbi:MAG TPA: hypothetical protein VLX68_10440 [Chitinivibrionales bacterium]|nr:hypothetical protein [Chitinivibrionales bacterium]